MLLTRVMALCSTYIQQPPVAEHTEQGVHVALAGEVQACPDVAARGHHSPGIPGRGGERSESASGHSHTHPNLALNVVLS